MSYLTLDADRLVRDAVDAYLEDRARPDAVGDCVYATRNSQYRVVEGVVHEASDTSLMGAELCGWLCEELGQPLMEPRWRPYGRAVFVERRSRHVVVTSRTLTRNVISGNVSPVPKGKRRPSVIPAAPPIPVLRSSAPPPPDGSPTPFHVSASLRQAALSIEVAPASTAEPRPNAPGTDSAHERPTSRPPSDEATVAKERSSYEDLLEASRTPSWGGGPLPNAPPPAPTRPIKLPAPRPSKEATVIKTPVVPEGSYKALNDAPEPSGEVLSDSDLILVHDEDE
jgi:hypothetical protein